MRVYQLAKQLGMDSKELLAKLHELKVPVKSHMSFLDDETAEIVKSEIESLRQKEIEANVIEVDFPVTIRDLAIKLNKKPSEILQLFIQDNKMYTINQSLPEEEVYNIGLKFKVTIKKKLSEEEKISNLKPVNLVPRPPIVTLMGHVDHGKTSILDYIRKSRIAQKESGGITQHIGAYQVFLDKGVITFLDTPGHELFSAMRARGAHLTDIVVLVVAADEGVKPQTIEAIDHAKLAKVPIIVAINKIDKEQANPDLVKQQLSKLDLVPDEWGGKTSYVCVSAKTGQGIKDLLDIILLEGEMLELKADPNLPAQGVVIESKLHSGKGNLIDILIQQGTLKVGDICVCGEYWGKIRAIYNDWGQLVEKVGPSGPAEILGLNGLPPLGEKLLCVQDEEIAKKIVEKRKIEREKTEILKPAHMTLESLHAKIEKKETDKFNVIIKCDVAGSLEAVENAVRNIDIKDIEVNFIHKGLGSISISDVNLAEISDAVIIGFRVPVDNNARELSRQKGIQIRVYQIIYELLNDIKAALEGSLAPQVRKVLIGSARVKKVFKLSKAGIVCGCLVEKGVVLRNALCHLVRDNDVIFKGKIISLKRFKNDVREVSENMECGISIGYEGVQEGDLIEVFREEEVK